MQPHAEELKKLREQEGLTQEEAAERIEVSLSRLQSWEQGRHTPPADKMDQARATFGSSPSPSGPEANAGEISYSHENGSYESGATKTPHVEERKVRPAGAGPGRSVEGAESIMLDTRLLEGSGISLDRHEFVRVIGSSMEPFLSHGQIVLIEPTTTVHGEDLYVYWNDMDEGHVVAMMSSTPNGLCVEKRGHAPSTRRYDYLDGHQYENEDGVVVELCVVGRVVGSVGRPAQAIAQANEAARHA